MVNDYIGPQDLMELSLLRLSMVRRMITQIVITAKAEKIACTILCHMQKDLSCKLADLHIDCLVGYCGNYDSGPETHTIFMDWKDKSSSLAKYKLHTTADGRTFWVGAMPCSDPWRRISGVERMEGAIYVLELFSSRRPKSGGKCTLA